MAGAYEQILGRTVTCHHEIDADASRAAILKGMSIAMRYLRKYSKVSLSWLKSATEEIGLGRVSSDDNESDLCTKPIPRETLVRHLKALGYYLLK